MTTKAFRANYWGNPTGASYFRFVEHDSGHPGKPFARGYHLGNVLVIDDTLFVSGTDLWDGERVDIFVSRNMQHRGIAHQSAVSGGIYSG